MEYSPKAKFIILMKIAQKNIKTILTFSLFSLNFIYYLCARYN